MAHVTNPISGISSECSIFFIEDSFYTHQSFIARLYILYIIYIKYISICKSPACLSFLILKLETSFLIYKQVPTFLSSFVSDARTNLITVNMVFLASQFNFNLCLFMDKIQCWKLFFKIFFQTFFFSVCLVWF